MRHLPSARPAAQRGVVLIIALVMLVTISLLTTLSIRSAVSTESVSGNVRTTELATQAAEIALRYCEEAVVQLAPGGTVTLTVTPTILDYDTATFPHWSKTTTTWDISPRPANLIVLPSASVNATGTATATYKRSPECLVERMAVVNSAGVQSFTSTFVITARGFGPEVPAADAARSRPKGTEVWMQSTIELQ
jgi:Tfp pilus assembly protein PilX